MTWRLFAQVRGIVSGGVQDGGMVSRGTGAGRVKG
ncbi:pentapeptide repeat-containing protein, partial [Streptomyces sp. RP5T]